MPFIKATPFPNPTDNKEFNGFTTYKGTTYEYKIFLTPLEKNTPEYEYVVDGIRKRRQKGSRKACLGTTKKVIKSHLNHKITGAYGFVNEKGSKDTVSGSIQLYNWSVDKGKYQVWINDICRHTPSGVKKSANSPLNVLFTLFEQMAAHILKASSVYLMVEPENEPIFVPIYEKYGFMVDREFITTTPDTFIVMRKTVAPMDSYNGFPFLLKKSRSSSNKTKRIRQKIK